jgi:hypothetical protein
VAVKPPVVVTFGQRLVTRCRVTSGWSSVAVGWSGEVTR